MNSLLFSCLDPMDTVPPSTENDLWRLCRGHFETVTPAARLRLFDVTNGGVVTEMGSVLLV